MPGRLEGAARTIGFMAGRAGKQRAAQSAAAIAGSKAEQAKPAAKPPTKPGPQLPGILGRMRDFAKKKTGGGTRQMSGRR